MGERTAGARWRQLLVALIVTSGATLAWVNARRRQASGSMPRSWSELDPAAPASLRPVAVEPASEPAAAPDPVTTPEPPAAESALAVPEPPAIPEPLAVPEPADVAQPTAGDAPVPGPYPGSVLPLDDGSAPSREFVIKGNAGSMRSHSPDSPYFGRTRAEVWFRTQEDAVAAGFAPWAPKK